LLRSTAMPSTPLKIQVGSTRPTDIMRVTPGSMEELNSNNTILSEHQIHSHIPVSLTVAISLLPFPSDYSHLPPTPCLHHDNPHPPPPLRNFGVPRVQTSLSLLIMITPAHGQERARPGMCTQHKLFAAKKLVKMLLRWYLNQIPTRKFRKSAAAVFPFAILRSY
jgi:hypothetical protein